MHPSYGKYPSVFPSSPQTVFSDTVQRDSAGCEDFSFLERSINVLVVDDEWSVIRAHVENLGTYKLYDVTSATSAKAADALLSNTGRFHVCLLDLGLKDLDNDEYILIKKYFPKVSFVIVTARDSIEHGFQSAACGACAVLKKPIDFKKGNFLNVINRAFFRSLIMPENPNKCKPVIRDAVEAFISTHNSSVSEWAKSIGIDERYLRMVWTDCYGYQPKLVVWLNKIYRSAFSYYTNIFKSQINPGISSCSSPEEHAPEEDTKQLSLFYFNHKSVIDGILSRRKPAN